MSILFLFFVFCNVFRTMQPAHVSLWLRKPTRVEKRRLKMGEIFEKFSWLSHLANVEWMKKAVKLEMRELRMKRLLK